MVQYTEEEQAQIDKIVDYAFPELRPKAAKPEEKKPEPDSDEAMINRIVKNLR